MTNEQKILLSAAIVNPDENQLDNLRKCMASDFNPDRLVDRATREGLGGFLYRNLEKADLLRTLKEIHQLRLYTNYYLTVRHNLKLLHALNTILAGVKAEKINVVLMQGISLLHQVYPDIGLRPVKDLDFWILPDDYAQLVNQLVGLGFKRDSSFHDAFTKGAVTVKIHSRISWSAGSKGEDISDDSMRIRILSDTMRINMDGREVFCFGPQDQFLCLGRHLLDRGLERLVWLVDINSLISEWERSDWEALFSRAEGTVSEAVVFPVFFILKSLFNIEFPPSVSNGLDNWKPDWSTKKILHAGLSGRSGGKWTRIPAGIGIRDERLFYAAHSFPGWNNIKQIFAKASQLRFQQPCLKKVLQLLGYSKAH
jgi:hypothetical protein